MQLPARRLPGGGVPLNSREDVMRTDMEIQKDVVAELRWEPSLRDDDIAVGVRDGVVTLAGFVDTYADKWTTRAGGQQGQRGEGHRQRSRSEASVELDAARPRPRTRRRRRPYVGRRRAAGPHSGEGREGMAHARG